MDRWWNTIGMAAALALAAGCGREGAPSATGAGGSGGAATGGSGGGPDAGSDGGPDAVAVDLPGPFTAWTSCGTLTLDRPVRRPYALSASADNRWLALLESVGSPPTPKQNILLWHLPGTALVRKISGINYAFDIDLAPDGSWVAITGDGSRVARTDDGTVVWDLEPPPDVPATGWVQNFAVSPDGLWLASSRSRQFELLRAADGVQTRRLDSSGASLGIAFSPGGDLLASSAPSLWRVGETVPLWSLPPAKPEPNLEANLTDHWATFSRDGRLILVQSALLISTGGPLIFRTATQIYDARTGALEHDLGPGLPRRPTFSPDGRWVVAGDQLINRASGQASALGVFAVASMFLSDGRIFAASAGGEGSLLCPH